MTAGATNPIAEITKAFHADNAELVRRLLDRHPEFKAKVNEPIGPFDSPPIIGVRSRAMLDVLLGAGADINAKSQWWAGGFGILHSASPELAAYAIERGAIVDAHAAARLGLFDNLKTLVALDPKVVHERGGDGQTPLHFASTMEIAKYLLDNAAEIDALDIDHESTPAQWMVGNRQDVARYLISRGCKTDILMAAALGDIELVRRLLDADPNCIRTRVSDEYFPMVGCKTGGTIYQWELGWHVSAHQVAKKFGHADILKLLFESSPPAVKLLAACWLEDDAMISSVRGEFPNIASDFIPEDRRQVAHAARNNEPAVVRRFLECGCPVDAQGQHQGTPLHWAAFHGNLEMTKLLLQVNPPLEVKDADFDGTPMTWAMYGSQNGWYCGTGDFAGVITALLAAGAERPSRISGTEAVQAVLRQN